MRIAVRERMSAGQWDLWFDGKAHITRSDDGLQIAVGGIGLRDWIRDHFRDVLTEAAGVFGLPGFRVVIDPELSEQSRQREQRPAAQEKTA